METLGRTEADRHRKPGLNGEFEEWFIHAGAELDAAVDDWGHGRWVEHHADGLQRVCTVSWRSVEESGRVAQQQLGMDVDAIRRGRTP